nr:MAG TPA: hypothetical protein [Caudoviricetes sp.]
MISWKVQSISAWKCLPILMEVRHWPPNPENCWNSLKLSELQRSQ